MLYVVLEFPCGIFGRIHCPCALCRNLYSLHAVKSVVVEIPLIWVDHRPIFPEICYLHLVVLEILNLPSFRRVKMFQVPMLKSFFSIYLFFSKSKSVFVVHYSIGSYSIKTQLLQNRHRLESTFWIIHNIKTQDSPNRRIFESLAGFVEVLESRIRSKLYLKGESHSSLNIL